MRRLSVAVGLVLCLASYCAWQLRQLREDAALASANAYYTAVTIQRVEVDRCQARY